MDCIRTKIALLAIAGSLCLPRSIAQAQAASLEDQQRFADQMKQLLRKEDYVYARAALLNYLELEPKAAPIKQEPAHYYMKTSAQTDDGLLGFQYPDDTAKKIIELLNEAVEAEAAKQRIMHNEPFNDVANALEQGGTNFEEKKMHWQHIATLPEFEDDGPPAAGALFGPYQYLGTWNLREVIETKKIPVVLLNDEVQKNTQFKRSLQNTTNEKTMPLLLSNYGMRQL